MENQQVLAMLETIANCIIHDHHCIFNAEKNPRCSCSSEIRYLWGTIEDFKSEIEEIPPSNPSRE